MPENTQAKEPATEKPERKKKQLCNLTVPGQIRLLTVKLLDEGQLVASIKTHHFSEEPRAPPYEALSYCWGPEPEEDAKLPKLQIECIDCKEAGRGTHRLPFDLWPNLHSTLLRIMSHLPAGQERILWTDRICIDQGDMDDKKVQLAQMADVYTKAQCGLVWLGEPAEHLSEAEVACNLVKDHPSGRYRLQEIAGQVSVLANKGGPRFDPRGAEGLPPANDAVWAILSDLVRKDWYRRIWTLQEAVLSQQLVVYYGAHVLPWDDIGYLVNVYGQVPVLRDHDDFQEKGRGQKWRFHHVMWIRQFRQRTPRIVPLTQLLQTSMYKESTKDEDRVYGVLGMVDPAIRVDIKADYRKPLKQIYIDACREALKTEASLQLLSLPFERDGRDGIPSWCPDLARWNGLEVQMQARRKEPRAKHSIWPTSVNVPEGGDRLHIRGFVADTIAAVSHAPFPGVTIREPERRWRLIAAYYRESLAVARAAGGNDPEGVHWRTLIADRHGFEGSTMTSEEAEVGYRSYFVKKQVERAQHTARQKTLGDIYASHVLTVCNRRKFFQTKLTGRVGLAPETCQVGDVVCVFQGAVVPHLLRRNIGGDDDFEDLENETFSFLGDCYVHGLMDSDAVDAFDQGVDEGRNFVLT